SRARHSPVLDNQTLTFEQPPATRASRKASTTGATSTTSRGRSARSLVSAGSARCRPRSEPSLLTQGVRVEEKAGRCQNCEKKFQIVAPEFGANTWPA